MRRRRPHEKDEKCQELWEQMHRSRKRVEKICYGLAGILKTPCELEPCDLDIIKDEIEELTDAFSIAKHDSDLYYGQFSRVRRLRVVASKSKKNPPKKKAAKIQGRP